ncbi:MAG: hypothetical protein ACXW6T_28590, partial [Candidatus Binatia bacterium]
ATFGARPSFRIHAHAWIVDQGFQKKFDFFHTRFGIRSGRLKCASGLHQLVEHLGCRLSAMIDPPHEM